MKNIIVISCLFSFLSNIAVSQTNKKIISLNDNQDLISVNVSTAEENYLGKKSLKVTESGENSEVKFVKINNLNFSNGSLEIDIAGKPAKGSTTQARGFVGVAFRINEDNSKFECFYLRPTNGRAEDQLRRNHSVQYISYPEFPWFTLRKDFPGKYESYVDLVPGEWTKVRIEVQGQVAKLFIHENSQPTLIVNDLKLGDSRGSIGLWIGPGTEAYFSNLRITN